MQVTRDLPGEEVVQLYVRQPDAYNHRPLKQLVGFRRVHLNPGERRRITFVLSANQMGSSYNRSDSVLEAGEYKILVGTSSEHLPLQAFLFAKQRSFYSVLEKVYLSESRIEQDSD